MNPLYLFGLILAVIIGGVAGFLFATLFVLADIDDDEKEYSGLLEED